MRTQAEGRLERGRGYVRFRTRRHIPNGVTGHLTTMHRKHGAIHARPRSRQAARGRSLAYNVHVWADHLIWSISLSRLIIGEVCHLEESAPGLENGACVTFVPGAPRFELGVERAAYPPSLVPVSAHITYLIGPRAETHPRWDNLVAQAHPATFYILCNILCYM